MQAIGLNIVTRQVKEEVKTDSGLLLSGDDAKNMRYGKAIVVSVGTEVKGIAEGDTVYYDRRSSYVMMVEGVQYTIIQSRDIVLVL